MAQQMTLYDTIAGEPPLWLGLEPSGVALYEVMEGSKALRWMFCTRFATTVHARCCVGQNGSTTHCESTQAAA